MNTEKIYQRWLAVYDAYVAALYGNAPLKTLYRLERRMNTWADRYDAAARAGTDPAGRADAD